MRSFTLPLSMTIFISLSVTAFAANESSNIEEIAASGKTRFEKHCTSCHTLGKGNNAGPDLRNMTKMSDTTRSKPHHNFRFGPLTDEMIDEIITFIKSSPK